MTPITNATPLIHLARIGRLDLLRLVFGELLVPTAVVSEVRPRIANALDAALLERWLFPATPLDAERTARFGGPQDDALGGIGIAPTAIYLAGRVRNGPPDARSLEYDPGRTRCRLAPAYIIGALAAFWCFERVSRFWG